LLNKNTNKRLTLEQVRQHPFFKKVNWTDVENVQNLKPPIKPKQKKGADLKVSLLDLVELKEQLKQSPKYSSLPPVDSSRFFKKFTYIKREHSVFIKDSDLDKSKLSITSRESEPEFLKEMNREMNHSMENSVLHPNDSGYIKESDLFHAKMSEISENEDEYTKTSFG